MIKIDSTTMNLRTASLSLFLFLVIWMQQSLALAADLPEDVLRREFTLPSTGNKVWIYLPSNYQGKKLPCVLIAPAGSRLYHGMGLGESSSPEHIPYVKAGFAVVAYELSGQLADDSDDETEKAIRDFVNSKGGVLDAAAALRFAASRVSVIDTNRIYAAGHSSAATTALALAHSSESIKGVAVYAPPLDPHTHLAPAMDDLIEYNEEFESFLDGYSPLKNAAIIKCPVLLFHAEDDELIDGATVNTYARSLISAGNQVAVIRTKSGGHYLPMIKEGIDLGIEWFRRIDSGAPLDDMIPEIQEMEGDSTLSGEELDGGEFIGETVKVKLDTGFKIVSSETDKENEFSVSWISPDGSNSKLHFRKQEVSLDVELRDAIASLMAEGGISASPLSPEELDDKLEPLELERGVFEGFKLSLPTDESDTNNEHFFLSANDEFWHANLSGDPEDLEKAIGVIGSFRSVAVENLTWNRIYHVTWDSPPHRVGFPPATGCQSAPSKILKGDPIVKPNIGSMRGPVLELGITKATEVANARAENQIRYDQIAFDLPDEFDAIRLSTELYLEPDENDKARYDLTVFMETVGNEAVIFGKSGTAETRGFGGLVRDRVDYPVGEVFPFQALIHRKEGWVEFLVNGETLLSSFPDRGRLEPTRIRISYGGSLDQTLKVGVDNFIIESGTLPENEAE